MFIKFILSGFLLMLRSSIGLIWIAMAAIPKSLALLSAEALIYAMRRPNQQNLALQLPEK